MATPEDQIPTTSENEATEAAPAEGEAAPELTEVNPTPEEGVAMKVTETSDDTPCQATAAEEKVVDPHAALMGMPVTNQNEALNCLIGFIGIAQRRGVFALDEAAKAFHCIQMFHPGSSNTSN